MSVAERRSVDAGRRLCRRPASALLLVALCATSLGAQREACRSAPPWWMGEGSYASPSAVREYGPDLLVLGTPSYRFGGMTGGRHAIADSGMAGFIFSRGGAARPVPRPAGVRAFVEPRVIALGDRDVEVVWSAPEDGASERGGATESEIWSGRLRRGVWSDVRRLGTFRTLASLTRQVASDLVPVGRDHVMAFAEAGDAGARASIVLLWRRAGTWSVERLGVAETVAASVVLEVHRGELHLAFVAGSASLAVPGGTVNSPLWLSRRTAVGWTVPRLISEPGAASVAEPKLLRSGDDLLAAWTEDGSPPRLRWRRVTEGMPLGPIRDLEGVADVTQGEAPFRDLLAYAAPDGTGRLLRLSAAGSDEVARVPAVSGLPPLVAGSEAHPLVLTVEPVAAPARAPFAIVAHDVRCALAGPADRPHARDRAPVPRR